MMDDDGFFLFHEPSRCDRRPAGASKGNFNGHIMAGRGWPGRMLYTGSWLEMSWAYCLDTHPSTEDLVEQVWFAWRDSTGKPRDHFFDFLVTEVGGRRIAYTVKPEARVTARFSSEIAQVARQARERGFVDNVRLLTDADLDPVTLHNARLMHSVRRPDPEADAGAAAVLAAMTGAVRLDELAARIGLGPRGRGALIRQVRSGTLRLLRHQRIDCRTELFRTGTAPR